MEPVNELIAVRRQKREALRTLGVDPYGAAFPVDGTVGELRAQFEEGRRVRAAGRITALRDMGKSRFGDISDATGRLQFYANTKALPEAAVAAMDLLDLGDFIGLEAEMFTTRTGELTLKVLELTPLAKALRPLPDKWHGLADVEQRYRQRYLDLIANEESRRVFALRSRIVAGVRRYLEDRGFMEVETPMMQVIAGGAAARPFQTRHHALGADLFLRIAPELYLKRLLVGGFPKVFELNRNFRNEGVSRRHNPEFTMLEVYWAYADFERMAELVEEMTCELAETFCGGLEIEHRDAEGAVKRTIHLRRPWRRARYHDLLREIDPAWFEYDTEAKRARCAEWGIELGEGMADFEITQQVFEKKIEEHAIDPLFVTHLPAELVPLARPNREDPSLVDVYELIINGMEISPGYSELNDPEVQRERLERQVGEERQNLDEDFLRALEHGMPPAGGIGVGIDRLVMMLTGAESLRDVILFPLMKTAQPSSNPAATDA